MYNLIIRSENVKVDENVKIREISVKESAGTYGKRQKNRSKKILAMVSGQQIPYHDGLYLYLRAVDRYPLQ